MLNYKTSLNLATCDSAQEARSILSSIEASVASDSLNHAIKQLGDQVEGFIASGHHNLALFTLTRLAMLEDLQLNVERMANNVQSLRR
ncbi:hypothetical protein GZH47_33110 (plasmid) [Paenibacillus rhizovicinus]|uniref:Uncharacterized protein n=1 Tax=Paenibacillus rhizovicinus TaxID=2704463 RepID=A0A6C0PAY2_9BACL|nr:hypothetical protein [Paenibacillus rhizovicinus]QHW35734.1 hypothetical protein GZH47_33110 [Paenibacillus rhizovicinus]